MLVSSIPTKTPTPWANSAGGSYIRTVPIPSQIGITNGAASWTDGFPPLCFVQQAAGGYPPDGRDVNYALNLISAWARWQQAGAPAVYDGTFSAAVGGYPNGAVIPSADYTGWWRSNADNNIVNPDTSTTAASPTWLPHYFAGVATQALSGSNVTLTNLQYRKPIITLTGTLTANVQVIFPNIAGEWVIQNNTSGAFSVTIITSGGAGVVVPSGSTAVYSDNTNMYMQTSGYLTTSVAAATYAPMGSGTLVAFQQTAAPTGWTKQTANNDAILRIVSGTPGSGGSQAFSTWNGLSATGATTLTASQIPGHTHSLNDSGHSHGTGNGTASSFVGTPGLGNGFNYAGGSSTVSYLSSTGSATTGISVNTTGGGTPPGGGSHTHPLTNNILYVDFIIASKN